MTTTISDSRTPDEWSGVAQSPSRRRPSKQRKRGGRDRSQRRFLFGSMTPMVFYILVFSALPILWAFVLAFFDYSARREGAFVGGLGGENPFIGVDNFTRMADFSETQPKDVGQFHNGLKVTLLFAVIVVPLNLMITLPLAALIESVHRRARSLFRTVFFLPVLTSAVGVALMWGFILDPQKGLLNGLISRVTGETKIIGWVTDPTLEFFGAPVALIFVAVAYLWQDIGYNLVIFIAALQAVPPSVKNAALIDGANQFQIFRRITLPLLKPTIMLAAILTTISAFQVFDLFFVMTAGGGPNEQTRAISIDIYESAFRFQRMGWSAAVSLVLFLLVLAISLIQNRLLRSKWEY